MSCQAFAIELPHKCSCRSLLPFIWKLCVAMQQSLRCEQQFESINWYTPNEKEETASHQFLSDWHGRKQTRTGGLAVNQVFRCMLWRLPGFSPKLPSLPVFSSQNMRAYLWQVFTVDLQAVIYAQAVQCTVCLCYAPLCFSSRCFSLRSQSSRSRWTVHLCLRAGLHTHTHTLSHTHPKNRRTNSVCWEEVRYNQFVKSTQPIIKPDQRLGANAVHHSLFWPAWIADLM